MQKSPALGSLNTKKYNDVIRGTWIDGRAGIGSFTFTGSSSRGLYKASRSRKDSVDLFHDKNKNGRIDRSDPIIGYATSAIKSTGGSGTWTWSSKANIGDYFAKDGSDAGLFRITNSKEWKGMSSNSKASNNSKSVNVDVVTGTWTVVGAGPNLTINATLNRSNYTYHARAIGGNGVNIRYNIFRDTNKNNSYDNSDKKVGQILVTSFAAAYFGTFKYSAGSGFGFTSNNNQPASFASGAIDWLA